LQFLSLRILVLVLALTLGVTGCASTKIVTQWSNPEYASPHFKKIMVIGVSRQPSIRRTFEEEFVTKLKAAGVDAVASYLYMRRTGRLTRAACMRR
jgi:hypothetical protein